MMNEQSSRQSFLGAKSKEVLTDLRVGIVGLGGGGSHIAQQLAHVGVGEFRLADPDRIEDSNLNRLVGGTVADVRAHRSKTAIAARQIRRVSPSARIVQINSRWQLASETLRDCDVIFGCIDSFGERRELEENARRFLIPYVDIGMDVIRQRDRHAIVGQVALSMPGHPCLRCMGIVKDSDIADEARQYGGAGSKPQVVWPNGVLASAAVGLAMQLVVPWHDVHPEATLLEYDGNRGSMVQSSVLRDLPGRCPHFAGAASLGDPWFSLDN